MKKDQKTLEVVKRDNEFIPIACKSCNYEFGLDSATMEKFNELNFKYRCPYCNASDTIE